MNVSADRFLDSVFHTVAYADVFEYPLTADEVHRYLTATKASIEAVQQALSEDTRIAAAGEYFVLRGREHLVEKRKRRRQIATRLWSKARRYGRIIASLPFVHMVAVTGSLAMNNTEEDRDIDFMIVTAPDRLWTARALTLFVARFAKLEGVRLCPNYLVTTSALRLNERSLYVAHELAQMVPLSGMEIYEEIRHLNPWTDEYLPNAVAAPEPPPGIRQASARASLQKAFEFLFLLPLINRFETWEMNRKIARLTHEQSSSFESYFSKDVCKGHIDKHGQNVITALAARLQTAAEAAPTEVV
ncbi:MAG TPA: hypothetical protein VK900_06330 [Anaerolineales bacterium]|nr:hypothetical protein [Anaerolineales bacterium]